MTKEEVVMRCPACSEQWDGRIPDVSFNDACWLSLKLLTIMKDAHPKAGKKEQDAIRLVGERLWDMMLCEPEQEVTPKSLVPRKRKKAP